MGFYYSFDQVTGKLFGPNHIQVGLAGLIVHGIQVVVNEIAGRDNTYGCGRRVP
jgi:accessory colonization factor AcfC